MARTVVIVGALDTKGQEFAFVKELIEQQGLNTLVVDIGVLGQPAFAADITRDEVARAGGGELADYLSGEHKDQAMQTMAAGVAVIVRRLYDEGRLDGIMGMGGTGGTSVGTAGMRVLPVGVPKVMVSTVGGGDVSAYAGSKDIVFVPSIVDVAGINRISRGIYTNAAGAIGGMVRLDTPPGDSERPLIAASMFGNTTQAVGFAREILEQNGYEVLVFHATGTGGRTMESLVTDGYIGGLLDLTTTELADYVCGGVFSAGPERCLAASRAGVPAVLVPGCVDMANFGGIDTVPEKYSSRKLYQWNPNVTLLRTNVEENRRIGTLLAAAANAASGPVAVMLPLRGVSMLDSAGGEFWDPEADQACYDAIKQELRPDIPVIELDHNINDQEFAIQAAERLLEMLRRHQPDDPNDGPTRRTIMRYTRAEVLERLQAELAEARPIVGAGAGTGISAKFAKAGGADLIIIYNSGKFRMAGHGSLAGLLAYGDANQIVKEMGEREVLPVVRSTPVIAGVMGTDPLRRMDYLLRELDLLGFSGINNFPTVGLIDGRFRKELERTSMGFGKEVDMIQLAHQHGFFTCVYVFNPDEARAMAQAGADVVIAHMGLTVGGSIGLEPDDALTLEATPALVQEIGEAAWQVNGKSLLFCHGGPIATPSDAAYVLERTDAVGFVGASSMERLPVETAITTTMQQFKACRMVRSS